MLSSASLAISMLGTVTATRTRTAPGEWVDGHWQPGATTTTAIKIVEQPVDGDELQQLPEGERTEQMRTVWTKSDLRTASVDDQTEADRLTFAGSTWKVVRVSPRAEGGFWRAIVGRTTEA